MPCRSVSSTLTSLKPINILTRWVSRVSPPPDTERVFLVYVPLSGAVIEDFRMHPHLYTFRLVPLLFWRRRVAAFKLTTVSQFCWDRVCAHDGGGNRKRCTLFDVCTYNFFNSCCSKKNINSYFLFGSFLKAL